MYVLLIFVFLRVTMADTVLSSKYESLSHIYSTYSETPGLDHYTQYGPAYDENIHHLREKAVAEKSKVRVLEIGVQSGGSTRVWKRYFRGTLAYVGLDIDPRCKMFQSVEEGINIVIGSQLDKKVLADVCTKYGPFDLVVDDGGHTNQMMVTSLNTLWNCMKDDGVYVIEDLHALNVGPSFLRTGEKTIFHEMAMWMKLRSPMDDYKNYDKLSKHPSFHLKKLAFYDSILFLHYADMITKLGRFMVGDHWLKGNRHSNEPPSKLILTDWCKNCCVGCYDD